jgi:hypothetical protein
MTNHPDIPMPDDWNDHAGWDTYYESRISRRNRGMPDDDTVVLSSEQLLRLAEELKGKEWRSGWIPGCGLSGLPQSLANLGLEVIATDLSPAAVQFQNEAATKFHQPAATDGQADSAGSLTAEVHDFRTAFRLEAFDIILNVKAFQKFPAQDLLAIARVHAETLRPGRHAYFFTQNVQGELRDELEQALADGGFAVPFLALTQSYRRALRETRIPHVFVLGHPWVTDADGYERGNPNRESAVARLKEISAEFHGRMAAEYEDENRRFGPDAKLAHVIYNTG